MARGIDRWTVVKQDTLAFGQHQVKSSLLVLRCLGACQALESFSTLSPPPRSESTAENVASLEQLSAQLKASAEAAEAFANKQDCSAKESVEGQADRQCQRKSGEEFFVVGLVLGPWISKNSSFCQDELVVGDFKERFDGRLKDLEGALKQSEYVNLIFQVSWLTVDSGHGLSSMLTACGEQSWCKAVGRVSTCWNCLPLPQDLGR